MYCSTLYFAQLGVWFKFSELEISSGNKHNATCTDLVQQLEDLLLEQQRMCRSGLLFKKKLDAIFQIRTQKINAMLAERYEKADALFNFSILDFTLCH